MAKKKAASSAQSTEQVTEQPAPAATPVATVTEVSLEEFDRASQPSPQEVVYAQASALKEALEDEIISRDAELKKLTSNTSNREVLKRQSEILKILYDALYFVAPGAGVKDADKVDVRAAKQSINLAEGFLQGDLLTDLRYLNDALAELPAPSAVKRGSSPKTRSR